MNRTGTTAASSPSAIPAMTGHEEHNDHYRRVAFYEAPRQRQRWGDHQVHPHTNWADTFFDLFYVAAAYNLGNVLREDPTLYGLLYVMGLFFPIQNLWTFKMFYDSRFYYLNDYFHGVYEIAVFLALAVSVLYIRPVSRLSELGGNPEMFRFSLSVLIAHVLSLGRLLEVAVVQRFVKHQTGLFPESFSASLWDAVNLLLSIAFQVAAAIYSGISYHNSRSSPVYDVEESTNGHRWLAEASAKTNYQPDHIPIWLLFGSSLIAFCTFFSKIMFYSRSDVDHKAFTVPINIDYAIHRYGEWTMLMLGESVLSLLIVDIVLTIGYMSTFLTGIVSIVLLEYLHFQSQPSDADNHAYRRSHWSGITFCCLTQIYSLALIVLGASFKMLLLEHLYENTKTLRNLFGTLPERFLAEGESAALRFSSDNRQERISHFFAGSLTVVFLSMDLISVAHRGVKANLERCQGCTKRDKVLAIAHVLCRVIVLLFTATLSQYFTSPDYLALVGLGTIFAQLCLRAFASLLFFHDDAADEDAAIHRAIEYNTARIHQVRDHGVSEY